MLSRIALAPRLGLATARLARPATTPLARTQPYNAAISPWIRTYAKSKGKSSTPPEAKSNPASSQSSPSAKPSPAESNTVEKNAANKEGEASNDALDSNDASNANATAESESIPFHKLPDLTQGIPSTLEQEMEGQSRKEDSSLETVDPEVASGRGRGGMSGESYVSTNERNRQWWTRFALVGTAVSGTLYVAYLGRNWEDEIEADRHPDIPNGWGLTLWWQRMRARMGESVAYYQEPAFEKLLPDPDPSFERPYTLVLSLEDLLVHSEWTREHGWRLAKRPGMDYFLRYICQYYELVLFTTTSAGMGEPLVRKLDPYRLIMWPLFYEATKYEDGAIVKDLSYLNRDLSKVIIIDTNAELVRKQPENAIVLEPWKGDTKDKELVGLIPFLEYIHTMQYSDVRKVIKSFDGTHIPTEFARREAIARKEFNKQMKEKAKSKPSGLGTIGNLLGMKPSNMSMTKALDGEQDPSEAFAQGKMLQDIARERGQRQFQLLDREIRENGEKWLQEEKEMMEKMQQEAMSSMMGSLSGWFGSKPDANQGEKKA